MVYPQIEEEGKKCHDSLYTLERKIPIYFLPTRPDNLSAAAD